jgi:hypothetical protein
LVEGAGVVEYTKLGLVVVGAEPIVSVAPCNVLTRIELVVKLLTVRLLISVFVAVIVSVLVAVITPDAMAKELVCRVSVKMELVRRVPRELSMVASGIFIVVKAGPAVNVL